MIFGYKPLGDVPFVGGHKPIVDKPRKAFSRQDNARSFDDAVRILEKRSRREAGSAQALADQAEIWRITVEECEKDYCEGPFIRADIEKRFADTPYGPRCIPAFGIWQKGKLRRIDDAAVSGHNDLTFMRETIVCDTADLPSMIAKEFGKHVGFDAVCLGIGTDDIAAAYRVCIPCAEPEYTVAAVWKPASVDGDAGVFYFVLRGFNFGLKSKPLRFGGGTGLRVGL